MWRGILAGAFVGLISMSGAMAQSSFDRDAWLSDYTAIKSGMAAHYANLDSRLMSKRANPASLDSWIGERLSKARSDLEAYDALRDFIDVFDDPHLKFRFDSPGSGIEVGQARQDASVASCEAAGYQDRKVAFAPRMSAIPGWKEIGGGPFPHAMAGDVGFLRIASFGENHFASACQRVFKPGMGERALQLATRAELQAHLSQSIAALRSAGARSIVIDLVGNGGGSEWDREAATLFTDRAMTRQTPRIADAPCDRSPIWKAERPCEVFRDAGGSDTLQGTGQWTGPVSILASGGTASAAEEFIGWLVDNEVAKLVGQRTMGAGCGYVDGGKPVRLKAAPITLHMPNCARFAADGTNEAEGWRPHHELELPMGPDPDWGRTLLETVAP